VAAAFNVFPRFSFPSITPPLVGERKRRFGHSRIVSVTGPLLKRPIFLLFSAAFLLTLTHSRGCTVSSMERQMERFRLLMGKELWAIPQVSIHLGLVLLRICAET
jgi:hypothetical protein